MSDLDLLEVEQIDLDPEQAGLVDLATIDRIVEEVGRAPEAVIPLLHAIQREYRFLPREALKHVCDITEITPASIMGVSTFYTHFRHKPIGKHLISVCQGTACHVKGSRLVQDSIEHNLKIQDGEDTDADGRFTVQEVACLGCCTLGPVVQIDEGTYGHISAQSVANMLQTFEESSSKPKKKVTHRTRTSQGGEAGPEIRIGLGSCCLAQGAEGVHDALTQELAASGAPGSIKQVGCTGLCHQAPLIELNVPGEPTRLYTKLKPETARHIIREHFKPGGIVQPIRQAVGGLIDKLHSNEEGDVVQQHCVDVRDGQVCGFVGPQKHIATELCDFLDPLDLDEYVRHDGFVALKKCLDDLSRDQIIEEVKTSGLRGRGGGGFPTHIKWKAVQSETNDTKYVICNGDEGDPGAFMDRMLLESVPFRVIEGMAIAALAVGSKEGIFYIRAEYPLAVSRIKAALEMCRERGFLGESVMGSDFEFNLVVKEGAGAFICGEETALIHSLEGNRGMPRLRPPYPAQSGLWEKPTLINNVETLTLVPWILRNGGAAFAELGTETSKGTKVFALAGKVVRGGLIEVPMGVTVRQIVEEVGGGCPEGRTFKAVQIGGPSGGCVPASLGETQIDYENLREVGAIMGSGGLVVLDDTDCMVDIARYFLKFTQDESCGKCTFCRVGTKRLLDILDRICTGKGRKGDLENLKQLSEMVSAGSICGLGKTAPNPVLSTLEYFREEYEEHIAGHCRAGKCLDLIDYRINDKCIGCTICSQHCPVDAIPMTPYTRHVIDMDICIRCDTCRVVCPEDAVFIASDSK